MKRGLVILAVVVLLLLVVGWFLTSDRGSSHDTTSPTTVSGTSPAIDTKIEQPALNTPPIPDPITDDQLRLRGRTYDLKVFSPCGLIEDNYYGATAATINDEGTIDPDGPQLMIQIQNNNSIATISLGENIPLVRAYKQKQEAFYFEGDTVSFSGPISGPDSEYLQFALTCP